MEFTLFLLPVLITVVGLIMFIRPPKKINLIVGYRTSKSMKDQESWDFANKYSGKLLIIFGCILLIISCLILGFCFVKDFYLEESFVSTIVLGQVAVLFIPIVMVEKKLNNRG